MVVGLVWFALQEHCAGCAQPHISVVAPCPMTSGAVAALGNLRDLTGRAQQTLEGVKLPQHSGQCTALAHHRHGQGAAGDTRARQPAPRTGTCPSTALFRELTLKRAKHALLGRFLLSGVSVGCWQVPWSCWPSCPTEPGHSGLRRTETTLGSLCSLQDAHGDENFKTHSRQKMVPAPSPLFSHIKPSFLFL